MKNQQINDVTFIYYLHRGDNIPFYIGKSNNPKKFRNRRHIRKYGENTQLEILDEVNKQEWKYWEGFWIQQITQWGFSLENLNKNGGGGCEYMTELTRQKISQTKKGHECYKKPERGEKISEARKGCEGWMKGKKFSTEHKSKLSFSQKGKKHKSKPYLKYDMDEQLIKIYPDALSASLDMNILYHTFISTLCINKHYPKRVINGMVKYKNYLWKF
jgi:hypothetical protein